MLRPRGVLTGSAALNGVVQTCDRSFRELVVFTPFWTQAVCIEPYTCITDAMHLQQERFDAGLRVLAAQQALSSGDLDSARSLLRNLPIIVGEMQVSTPLVPVRFKLHAAAEAADAKQWDRTRALLKEANQTVQRLETLAGDAELRADITAIGDDLDRMSKQTATPRADQIRELAKRTRDLGSDDQG